MVKLIDSVPFDGFNTPDGLALIEGIQSRLDEVESATLGSVAKFSPSTAPDDVLDFLGLCLGYGDFWLSIRSAAVKRQLIALSARALTLRGTKYIISQICNAVTGHPVSFYDIDDNHIWILLDIHITRGSFLWFEVERVIYHFGFVGVSIKPTYEQFFLDVSHVGEPILS